MKEDEFKLQHLKDAFAHMDKEPVQEVTNKDIELKFITDLGNVVWLPKEDYDFQVAYRKHKAMEPLTEKELKLLNLEEDGTEAKS